MFDHFTHSDRLCSRRLFLSGAGASLILLPGCSLISQKGVSGHGTRRQRSPIDAVPLQFDVAQGMEKLNAVRRRKLLPPFFNEPRLQEAAQRHADMMGRTGRYGHKIGVGTDFKSRIFAVGFDNSAGENIGVGYRSVDEAIEGWMNSRGHRKNMLKRNFNAAGLAYAFNSSGMNPRYTHFWVLIVGRA